MIQYPIAIILSVITLYTGKYLAKISREEVDEYHEKFKFSLPIFISVSVFIITFLLGMNVSLALTIALISIFVSIIKTSMVTYFVASIVLAYSFNEFLLSTTIEF